MWNSRFSSRESPPLEVAAYGSYAGTFNHISPLTATEFSMSALTVRRTVTIINSQGLHARPADLFVKLANQYRSTIEVVKNHEVVDGKSILSILTLAAVEGTQLEICATGDDAEAALGALCALVDQGFSADEAASPPRDGVSPETMSDWDLSLDERTP